MKNHLKTIIAAAFITGLFMITACDTAKKGTSATETQNDSTKIVYVCPMHPEVTSDKPGECPKCGMTLVKKQ